MESTTTELPQPSSEKTKVAVRHTRAKEKSPGVAGDRTSVTATATATATPAPTLLSYLLEMAHKYQCQGKVRQAMDIYWKLVDQYPESEQANDARAMLLELARGYERDGKLYVAREIYEHLL